MYRSDLLFEFDFTPTEASSDLYQYRTNRDLIALCKNILFWRITGIFGFNPFLLGVPVIVEVRGLEQIRKFLPWSKYSKTRRYTRST